MSLSFLITQELSFGIMKANFTSGAGRSTTQAKGKKTVGDMITHQENTFTQATLTRTSETDTA